MKKMKQIHGKIETNKYSSLEQILGDTGLSRYGTLDASEYERQVRNMNKSDLQTHAVSVGLIPIDNREMLTKRLLKEFNLYAANYKTRPNLPTTKKPTKQLLKILSAGR